MQFVPRPYIAVLFAEDLAVAVEAPEHLQEPGLICALLLEELHQSPDGNHILLSPPILSNLIVNGDSDQINKHVVRWRIWDRFAYLDIFSFGHPNLPAADLVHELDAYDGLLVGGQNEPGKQHSVVKVLLAPDNIANLLP